MVVKTRQLIILHLPNGILVSFIRTAEMKKSKSRQVSSANSQISASDVKSSFHSLGIEMDTETIERMAKLGLMNTIAAVSHSADVLEQRRESMIEEAKEAKKPKTKAVMHFGKSSIKEEGGIDDHRIRALLIDLYSPGGNIHSKDRLVLEDVLTQLESWYFRHREKFLTDFFRGHPIKTKKDISKLPGDVRYLNKEDFMDLLKDFIVVQKFDRGSAVLFDHVKETKSIFGKSERVVDLISLIDILKGFSVSKRRSFDYTSSRVTSEIAFWNLSSSKIPTPKTEYPLDIPAEGKRKSSAGAMKRNKVTRNTIPGESFGIQTVRVPEDSASMLMCGKPDTSPGGDQGRSVFGFFEKGILRLEPKNNLATKVQPSPILKNRFTAEYFDSPALANGNGKEIKERGLHGGGVPQNFGFGDSPRKAPEPVQEGLSVSEIIYGSKGNEGSSLSTDKSHRKTSYFGTSPRSPIKSPISNGKLCMFFILIFLTRNQIIYYIREHSDLFSTKSSPHESVYLNAVKYRDQHGSGVAEALSSHI